MAEATFDIPQAHRWFAIECNNRAWDLVESSTLTPAELGELLHTAHASCLHWSKIGKPIHQLRAQTLLVMAYVKASLPECAVWHAENALQLATEELEEITPFDMACLHGAAARAYRLVNDTNQASQHYKTAVKIADQLTESADREVFDQLFPAIKE